ncbi:DeoR/GlpR transcriptional regulator [Chitinophaga oryzae]|uniref:DeoR/GlpR transcriptional regulator n=1 Tax=Chitinophaga oryzae TaxID=2725414 RepID=A0ABX6LBB0_9BACT|nr:transcriptional repressor AgaR [Chitinophaga oryzae]QJB37114.1 DeoR/GlpR transcriptional regulator [Chitinophaga oryzae]
MEESQSGSTVTRRNEILKKLHKKGQVLITELSKEFNVSEVTIRNDLDQLEQKNMLLRARGGAIKLEHNVGVDQQISEKNKLHYVEKMAIGKAAAALVRENDTMIVDSGTTTAELVKHLQSFKSLNVITNAMNIVNMLVNYPNINVIIPGGYLRQNSMSLVGPLAEKNLRSFHVDKLFLGVDGFDTRSGIYTPNMEEAYLNEIMIDIANQVIVLADSSKFNKKSLAFICAPNKIHTVITDAGIQADDKKRLEDLDIKVIIA